MINISSTRFFTPIFLLCCLFFVGCETVTTDEGTGEVVPKVDKEANIKSALNDYITLANGYLKEGKRASALTAINKGLAIDDESPELLNTLAVYYMTDGEDELAEKEYKKAIRYNPDDTASKLNYGVFLYGHKRYDEACDMLGKATEDVQYAKRNAAFLNYGVCLKHQGKMKEAEDAFRRSYVNDSRNPRVVLQLAVLKFDTGDFEQSTQLYEKFLSMSKQNAESLWLGIRLANVMGQEDKQASYALFLKNQFPASPEYSEYKAWSASK
ncbi:MAG TPA: type IV pilus biogenesis/stability protein PilW [Pseudomonadales bacterium]|nr:type IV pilus biogenesis/stability protein PilW [Pseudomonadales bacterium]